VKKIQDSPKVLLLQPTPVTTAIVPLQLQQEKIISDQERLVAQVERINRMAGELEAAILELKAIANTLNSQKCYPLIKPKPCIALSVPWVKQKSDQSFILTTRRVDLFRAEREAAQLAQQLRQQTKKRLASQRHQKNKDGVEAQTKGFFKKALVNKS
jgi:hypothetical protein